MATTCRLVSSNATSTGKSTPGRGIIWRSKASPWMLTMPGRTRRSLASTCCPAGAIRTDRADCAVRIDVNRRLDKRAVDQNAAAIDAQCIRHAAAATASYLARKSSTSSERKSGSARHSRSWSQSHLSFPENSIRGNSHDVGESAHHLTRCMPSSLWFGPSLPTSSSPPRRLEVENLFLRHQLIKYCPAACTAPSVAAWE